MSIQAMNWAYNLGGLSMAQKFALVTLANYADDFGVCWPEQSTLRADCACSERTMREAISALEQARLIARKTRRRRDGSRRSDVYLLVGFAGRKEILGAEHHPILTAAEVAEMVEFGGADDAQDEAADGAESPPANRQNSPVDAPDQPAESAAATGKICTTNRQNLPVTIRQEPPEEPSREPSEEEGAQARAGKSDFSKADGTDASGTPPASGLSGLLRRVLVAVNHDPDSDLPHWWTGPGALTSMERWRAFGLSDDQIVACAADTRKDNATPPEGPKALDRAMQRFADSLRKRVGKPAIMTPEQERAARLENLKWWAKNIEERPSLAASNIKLGLADELLTEGLTTPQALRRACVPFRIGPGTVCARLFPEYQP